MKIILTFIFSITILFSACLKEEKPLLLPEKNLNSKYVSFDAKPENESIIFFDFSSGNFITKTNKEWMLAFDAEPSGYSIRVNHSILGRQLYESMDTAFSTSAAEIIKSGTAKMDSVNSWKDNTAIGDWWRNGHNANKTYVYHIPEDIFGEGEHQFKFKLIYKNDKVYELKFVDENTKDKTVYFHTVNKDNDYNYAYFSFYEKGKIVQIEPPKKDWDIVFTQYRDMVVNVADNKLYPYQVLGVLINPDNTLIHKITTENFDNIDFTYCSKSALCNISNTIGYEWKSYDLALAKYSLTPNLAWVLKDNEEIFHKMRFISFYNNKGISGYPTFEYVSFK